MPVKLILDNSNSILNSNGDTDMNGTTQKGIKTNEIFLKDQTMLFDA